jgi:hypothetical protein
MVAELRKIDQSLYDTDYNLWVLETVGQLRRRDLDALDWENLIEEVMDLSRREKRRLDSLLTRLFEHLLKLNYWESERLYNQNHWKKEIRNFRKQIRKDLRASPSLGNYILDIWEECYQDARELFADESDLPLGTLSVTPIANLDQILDEDWLP